MSVATYVVRQDGESAMQSTGTLRDRDRSKLSMSTSTRIFAFWLLRWSQFVLRVFFQQVDRFDYAERTTSDCARATAIGHTSARNPNVHNIARRQLNKPLRKILESYAKKTTPAQIEMRGL